MTAPPFNASEDFVVTVAEVCTPLHFTHLTNNAMTRRSRRRSSRLSTVTTGCLCRPPISPPRTYSGSPSPKPSRISPRSSLGMRRLSFRTLRRRFAPPPLFHSTDRPITHTRSVHCGSHPHAIPHNLALIGALQWITIGGSYSGALSAWFRLKYPHLTIGAVSSSGVVNAIYDFTAFDQQGASWDAHCGSCVVLESSQRCFACVCHLPLRSGYLRGHRLREHSALPDGADPGDGVCQSRVERRGQDHVPGPPCSERAQTRRHIRHKRK